MPSPQTEGILFCTKLILGIVPYRTLTRNNQSRHNKIPLPSEEEGGTYFASFEYTEGSLGMYHATSNRN